MAGKVAHISLHQRSLMPLIPAKLIVAASRSIWEVAGQEKKKRLNAKQINQQMKTQKNLTMLKRRPGFSPPPQFVKQNASAVC